MVIQGVSAPGQNPAYRPSAHFLSAGKGAPAAARLLPGVRAAPAPLRRGPPGAFCREETALAGCRSRAGRMGGLTAKRDTLLPWRFAPPGGGHRPCHSTVLILAQPGAKAPGQRPPRPRRALASVSPGPSAVRGTLPCGRGKRGSRFRVQPKRASPFPGSGGASRQAGGRIAVSAPCPSCFPWYGQAAPPRSGQDGAFAVDSAVPADKRRASRISPGAAVPGLLEKRPWPNRRLSRFV